MNVKTSPLIFIICVCLIFLFIQPLHAQFASPFISNINIFTVNQGLADNTIYSLDKDSRGFIWTGTSNGLSRYDGHEFKTFSASARSSIPLNHQNSGNVLIDEQERMWVGTWGQGVYVYDANLNLITHIEAIGIGEKVSSLIQVLYEDSQGNIWIGSNGGGLAVVDVNMEVQHYVADPMVASGLKHNRIWDIEEGSNGRIWIATGGGLNYAEKTTSAITLHTQPIPMPAGASSNYIPIVRTLFYADNLGLWIGTDASLFRFSAGSNSFTEIPFEQMLDLPSTAITKIIAAKNRQLWIGTQSGVLLFDSDLNQFISLSDNGQAALFSHFDVRDLLFENDNLLWIATRASGLVQVDFGQKMIAHVASYVDENSGSQPLFRAQTLTVDKANTLWLGSSDILMFKPNGQTELQQLPSSDIEWGMVNAIFEFADGRLWVGSNTGLYEISASKDTIVANKEWQNKSGATLSIAAIFEDSKGNIWIGTYRQGVFIYDGSTFHEQRFLKDENATNHSALSIAEDGHGRIWIGTNGSGVFRVRPHPSESTQFIRDSVVLGELSSKTVAQVLVTSNDTVWVATDNGLNRYDNYSNNFVQYGEDKGFTNTNIKAIAQDSQNRIWVSTDSGIYRQNSDGNFVSYSEGKSGYISRAVGIASDSIYFGLVEGLTRIDIGSDGATYTVGKVHITDIEIDNISLPELDFTNATVLQLPHKTKALNFSFSNNNFGSFNASIYSHRLMGLESEWSAPSSNNTSLYAGLRPGLYDFQIRVMGKEGNWGETHSSFRFEIMSPWWLTPTFLASSTLLLLLLLYLLYRSRVRFLRYRNIELKREVKTRSAALLRAEKQLLESAKNASVSSLVSGVAHEINTPIGIGVTAGSLLEEKAQSLLTKFERGEMKKSDFLDTMHSIQDSTQLINGNLDRAKNLIDNFKKISINYISETQSAFNLHQYLHEISIGFRSLLSPKKIDLKIDCPADLVINSNPGAIAQMLTQLITNAESHAFEATTSPIIELKVELIEKSGSIRFYVRDNGKGIAQEHRQRIFEPFFTTERRSGMTGIGLQIVNNVVTIRLKGSIKVESSPSNGTCFTIEFPVQLVDG